MNVSLGERWENFVQTLLSDGRYNSQSEVIREGLRLVEEREAKLADLRRTLSTSIENGGDNSDDDVALAINNAIGDS